MPVANNALFGHGSDELNSLIHQARELQHSTACAWATRVGAWEKVLQHPRFRALNPHTKIDAIANCGREYVDWYLESRDIGALRHAVKLLRHAVRTGPADL